MSERDQESVERVIPAPAEKIFALIADPSRHHEIDGSGTVRDVVSTESPLQLGSKFGMSMKLGMPYRSTNVVVELDENRRIAWQTFPFGERLKMLIGGRIWRYELEPVDGGTRVRETWDISKEAIKLPVSLGAVRKKTREAMEHTLENIEKICAG